MGILHGYFILLFSFPRVQISLGGIKFRIPTSLRSNSRRKRGKINEGSNGKFYFLSNSLSISLIMMKKRNLSVDRERISWLIETYRRLILDSTVLLQHVPDSITNKILAIVSEKNVVLDIWSQADWLDSLLCPQLPNALFFLQQEFRVMLECLYSFPC